jgi:hypothetical protein
VSRASTGLCGGRRVTAVPTATMFCHITANWRGKPLVSHEVIVNLIGNNEDRSNRSSRVRHEQISNRNSRER